MSTPARYPLRLLVVSCVVAFGGVQAAAAQVTDSPPRYAEVNGVRIAYWLVGQGEPLVLLHGYLGTAGSWRAIVADLAESFQLIIPDLRGHGRSYNPQAPYTHVEVARDVYALLDQLGIGSVAGVGFSSGAVTLLHMATSQPERITSIALVGAAPYVPKVAQELFRSMSPDSVSAGRLEALGRTHGGGPDQARQLLNGLVALAGDYDDISFTPPKLATIQARTLIVHGDRDAAFPVHLPFALYEAIPHSFLMVIPNGGHVAFPPDPEGRRYFVTTLKRFLRDSWTCNTYCGRVP